MRCALNNAAITVTTESPHLVRYLTSKLTNQDIDFDLKPSSYQLHVTIPRVDVEKFTGSAYENTITVQSSNIKILQLIKGQLAYDSDLQQRAKHIIRISQPEDPVKARNLKIILSYCQKRYKQMYPHTITEEPKSIG